MTIIRYLVVLLAAAVVIGAPPRERSAPKAIISHFVEEEPDMAATVWITSDGDFGAAASWDNGVPGADDTFVFDGTSQHDATTNLNRGTTNMIMKVTPDYLGNIGGPGNPLQFSMKLATQSNYRGVGTLYFKGTSGNTGALIVDSTNLRLAVAVDGDMLRLHVKSGTVRVASTAWSSAQPPARMIVAGPLARVIIDAADSTEVYPDRFTVVDGVVNCNRVIGSGDRLSMSGGSYVQDAAMNSLAILNILGGTFKPTVDLACEINVDGVLDVSGLHVAPTTSTLVMLPNGTIIGGSFGALAGSLSIDLREEYP